MPRSNNYFELLKELKKFPIILIFSPQNCDNQDLRVATSRSGYPKKRTLPLTEDFCLIVSKMRNVCKNKFRKKAFEEHYRHETSLPHGGRLNCRIIEGAHILAFWMWSVLGISTMV